MVWAPKTAATPWGPRPMMPAKMISDTPLPIPYSVISSPNHINMTVPAVNTRMICSRWNHSSGPRIAGCVFWKRTVKP